MSMIGNFVAITSDDLDRLISDPDEIEELLYPDGGSRNPENHLDIDKAWHGIHFLLTGESEECDDLLSQVVMGGTALGPDVGYGPARYLTPQQVSQLAGVLAKLPSTSLAARYAPAEMEEAGIYPDIWQRDGDEALEYLLHYYDKLVDFYHQGAAQGHAVLQYLN